MEVLLETLNERLHQRNPETANQVRERVSEIIGLADQDAPRALTVYVPLTTQNRRSLYEVPIPKLGFLNSASVANVQAMESVPTVCLERKIGNLPEDTLGAIREALLFALDLGGLSH